MALWVISPCAMKTKGKKPHNVDHDSNTAISSILCPPSPRPALPTECPICPALPFPLKLWDWGWSVTQPHQQRSCTLQWLREAPGNHRSLHWFPVRFDLFWPHAEGNYLVSQMLSCGGDICHTWKCLWKRRGVDLYTKNWLNLTLEMLVCRRELIHDLRNLLTEKRPALDPAGFNSPKPPGPSVAGWPSQELWE